LQYNLYCRSYRKLQILLDLGIEALEFHGEGVDAWGHVGDGEFTIGVCRSAALLPVRSNKHRARSRYHRALLINYLAAQDRALCDSYRRNDCDCQAGKQWPRKLLHSNLIPDQEHTAHGGVKGRVFLVFRVIA